MAMRGAAFRFPSVSGYASRVHPALPKCASSTTTATMAMFQRRHKYYVMKGHVFAIDPFVSEEDITAAQPVRKIKNINGNVVRMLDTMARKQSAVNRLAAATEALSKSPLLEHFAAIFPRVKERLKEAQQIIQLHALQQQLEASQKHSKENNASSQRAKKTKKKQLLLLQQQEPLSNYKDTELPLLSSPLVFGSVPVSTISQQAPRFGVFTALNALPRISSAESQSPAKSSHKRSSSVAAKKKSKRGPSPSAPSPSVSSSSRSATTATTKPVEPSPANKISSTKATAETVAAENAASTAVEVPKLQLASSLPMMNRRKKAIKSSSDSNNSSQTDNNTPATTPSADPASFDESSTDQRDKQ